ncbi:MAG: hypothetical protein E2O29_01995 [Deltaproteobacteria bacterium]|nr:MAG: hypothetical protein E2O29_01995 [Deltaproteobacteria bacterium]
MKIRIFKKPDGSVLITQFAEKARLPGETDADLMTRQTAKLNHPIDGTPQKDLPYEDVELADIPTDRTDREQWRQKNDGSKEIVWVDTNAPNPVKIAKDLTEQYVNEAKQGVIDATTLADLIKHQCVLDDISKFKFIQAGAEIV